MPNLCFLEQSEDWVEPVLQILGSTSSWKVVCQFNRWGGSLCQSLPQKPDLYLVGFESFDNRGLGLMRKVMRHDPRAHVMALIPNDKGLTMAALLEGARGVCFRHETMIDLVSGLDALNLGQFHLSPDATRIVINECLSPQPQQQHAVRQMAQAELTPKEKEVLHVMRLGQPTKRVADHMGISIYTVNQHLRSIYRKMNVRNRVEAIHLAHTSGLM
jgi:DNA-binding NarL/FixJ family response regulator